MGLAGALSAAPPYERCAVFLLLVLAAPHEPAQPAPAPGPCRSCPAEKRLGCSRIADVEPHAARHLQPLHLNASMADVQALVSACMQHAHAGSWVRVPAQLGVPWEAVRRRRGALPARLPRPHRPRTGCTGRRRPRCSTTAAAASCTRACSRSSGALLTTSSSACGELEAPMLPATCLLPFWARPNRAPRACLPSRVAAGATASGRRWWRCRASCGWAAPTWE